MKTFIAVFFLLLVAPAFGHRLDEYLQAATFEIQPKRLVLELRLTPGIEISDTILASLDTNKDGAITETERSTFARRVADDLRLTIDGKNTALRLTSSSFSEAELIKEGIGQLQLSFEASLPTEGSQHQIIFENHHQPKGSLYLANCLVPRDPALHILDQKRTYDQSTYEVDYSVASVAGTPSEAEVTEVHSGRATLFTSFFYQGIHHILTGFDHLLFVGALVFAVGSFWELVKVVSAFTLAHTITLALATFKLVHVSEQVVEPLIAASIVFVAGQNLIAPRQARGASRLAAAFLFGLFHGLGFAGGLLDALQRMPAQDLTLALGGFSAGVEAGHQFMVIPLFALLTVVRHAADATKRNQFEITLCRIGSAVIGLAGTYYFYRDWFVA